MKKLLLFIITLAQIATTHAQWTNVSFNKPGEKADYHLLRFVDRNVGTICEYTDLSSERPVHSYNTFNGGKSWTKHAVNVITENTETPLPITPNTWIKVYDKIYISEDSLKTWKAVSNISFIDLRKVSYNNFNKTIYLFNTFTDKLAKSTDLGKSWMLTSSLPIKNYSDMSFPTSEIGYVVGKTSTITKTINGGSSWFNLNMPFGSYQLNGVDFINENEGIIVAEAGKIFKTMDGGKTWKDHSISTTTTLTAIDYINSDLAYACGYSGSIYKSINGGITWQKMESGTSNNLLAINFVDSTLGYCSGSGSTLLQLDNSPKPKVTKLTTNKTLYCESDSVRIGYTVDKKFDESNFFVLQMSDGLGRFNQAKEILRWNGDTSGVVKIKLPTGLITDQNYRFRIYSTSTDLPSVANDSSLQINRSTVPAITIIIQPSNTVCEGTVVTITAQAQGGGSQPKYEWTINNKIVAHSNPKYSYLPKDQDKITVKMTSNSPCVSTTTATSNTIAITVNPVPERPSIVKENSKIVSSASLGNQWFLNGSAMKDSTKQAIVPSKDGGYSVQVTLKGCTSPMSSLYDRILAFDESQAIATTLVLYPNPAREAIHITTNRQLSKITIYNSNGAKVIESKTTTTISLQMLPQGLYLLEAIDEQGNRYTSKFEKD